MLQVPSVFKGIGYYQGISLVLWIIVIIGLFSGFFIFMLQAKKSELKSQRMLFTGYGVFSLLFGLTRLFFIIAVYSGPLYDFYTILGYITAIIGINIWIFIVETYMIKQTKRLFSILTFVGFVIALVAMAGAASRYLALTILYIIMPFSLAALLLLYVYLIIKTTGDIREKSLRILIGLMLICIGHIMDSEFFIGATYTFMPLEIAPSVMIAGMLIFIVAQLKE